MCDVREHAFVSEHCFGERSWVPWFKPGWAGTQCVHQADLEVTEVHLLCLQVNVIQVSHSSRCAGVLAIDLRVRCGQRDRASGVNWLLWSVGTAAVQHKPGLQAAGVWLFAEPKVETPSTASTVHSVHGAQPPQCRESTAHRVHSAESPRCTTSTVHNLHGAQRPWCTESTASHHLSSRSDPMAFLLLVTP